MPIQPKPYVYLLTHRETGHFYIGYRCANKLPATLDLGQAYKSSSNIVKNMGFENFSYRIIHEFDDANRAYDFEQRLIESRFDDPLCLNNSYQKDGGRRFKTIPGNPRRPHKRRGHTQEARDKMSKAHKGRATSCGPKSAETRAKMSAAKKGRKFTPEHVAALKAGKLRKKLEREQNEYRCPDSE